MARAPRARPKASAALVIAAALTAGWETVDLELARYHREPAEAGTHDLRVGMRRFLAAAELARALEPEALPEKLSDRVKRFLKALSPLRDLEIQLEAVEKRGLEPRVRHELTAWIRRRERKLGKALHRRAGRLPIEKVRLGVARACAALESRAGDRTRSAELVVLGAIASRYAAFDRGRRSAREAKLEELHRTRVAFKKYRYAVELGEPLLKPLSKPRRDEMKRFQDELGALQDSVVVLALFERRQATQALAGELRREQEQHAAHIRELLATQAAAAVPAFSEPFA